MDARSPGNDPRARCRTTTRLLAASTLLSLASCAGIQVRTDIVIEAPPSTVWQILTDLESYPTWNPYHLWVKGDCVVDADLEVCVKRPDGRVVLIEPHVLRVEPERELAWGGGIHGVFWGEHVFRLEPLDDGERTVVVHDEDFHGFAVGFADLPPEVLTEGNEMVNRALKARAETVHAMRTEAPTQPTGESVSDR